MFIETLLNRKPKQGMVATTKNIYFTKTKKQPVNRLKITKEKRKRTKPIRDEQEKKYDKNPKKKRYPSRKRSQAAWVLTTDASR